MRSNELTIQQIYELPEVGNHEPHEDFPLSSFVGVEIEVEGVRNDERFFERIRRSRHWKAVSDGSLRNGGTELVMRGPRTGRRLQKSLDQISLFFEGVSHEFSERCSTHVHVDVRDLTEQQFVNFLCISTVFELCLFELDGKSRTANNFCASTERVPQNFEFLLNAVGSEAPLEHLDSLKYSGISANRLRDLGTLEFRMFEGTADPDRLKRIIMFLQGLKELSKGIDTPEQVIEYKKTNSVRELFNRFFSNVAYTDRFESLMQDGIRILNDILFFKKIKELEEAHLKPLKEKKNLIKFELDALVQRQRELHGQIRSLDREIHERLSNSRLFGRSGDASSGSTGSIGSSESSATRPSLDILIEGQPPQPVNTAVPSQNTGTTVDWNTISTVYNNSIGS